MSERRTTANRKNAAKSTGPRTTKGKARSAANATRHGLNTALALTPGYRATLDALAQQFESAGHSPTAAKAAAEARLHLTRVQAVKRQLLEIAASKLNSDPEAVGDLAAHALLSALPDLRRLEEYERKARSRLKRAIRQS